MGIPNCTGSEKDGGVRFCIDNTQKDAQPLPGIDETLDALNGACYFSTLDLASGYWKVELHPKDKEKTAFVTPFGFYQFRVTQCPCYISTVNGTGSSWIAVVVLFSVS